MPSDEPIQDTRRCCPFVHWGDPGPFFNTYAAFMAHLKVEHRPVESQVCRDAGLINRGHKTSDIPFDPAQEIEMLTPKEIESRVEKMLQDVIARGE